MKTSDTDILFLPDDRVPPRDHWQSRWQQKLSTARLVMPHAQHAPERARWIEAVSAAANAAERPLIMVGHGHGIFAAIAALPFIRQRVAGGFFAAPHDLDAGRGDAEQATVSSPHGWPETLRARLPFPSMLVASRNDPASSFAASEKLADDLGSLLLDAGEAGHIDAEAGYGPWPEGLMAFAQFLRKLD